MKNQFCLHFPTMPKGTAQQKGYNRKTGKYFKKNTVATAEYEFKVRLIQHKPTKPSNKPIKLTILFNFDVKDKKLWGLPKTTRPDTDNYLKLFKDCMTDMRFWLDDSQVWDERVVKVYSEQASITVIYEETDIEEMSTRNKAVGKAKKEGET